MHYYVDGYNLLFRVNLDEADFKTQRSQIIKEINAKIEITQMDVTLVFDAAFRSGESTISHFRHLEVLYTASGESADDFIIDGLKSSYKQLSTEVVVTSDKRLAWRARRVGASTQTVEEFLGMLNKIYKNKLRYVKKEKVISPLIQVAATPLKIREGGLEYYLHAFETRYQILLDSEEKPKKKRKKLSKSE